MAGNRVTRTFAEVLNTAQGDPTPKARVTRVFAEVLNTAQGDPTPKARVSVVFVEVLSSIAPLPKGPPLALFPTPILTSSRGLSGLGRRTA
jgi:hypothetical protein